MSLLRILLYISLLILPAGASLAGEGFYGFSQGIPLSSAEKNTSLSFTPRSITNYRQKMRDILNMLTSYARKQEPKFKIVVHEGRELLDIGIHEASLEGYNIVRNKIPGKEDKTFLQHDYQNETSPESLSYLNSLDGILLNHIFCPSTKYTDIPQILKQHSLKIAAIDYCSQDDELDEAIQNAIGTNIILYGFTNIDYAFNDISHQMIINENAKNIFEVNQAKNILILTNDKKYKNKADFIASLRNTNFDIIIIPALFNEKYAYTPEEIHSLKFKKNGTTRIVLAEMNISEISPNQIIWQKTWDSSLPNWIKRKSLTTPNAYLVEYWHPEWQKLLSFYMKGIVNSKFDGVLYTGLNTYEYFDALTPLD